MTSDADHAHNLKLIEKVRIHDWAYAATERFKVTEITPFMHRETKHLMPLWFIAQQSIAFQKEHLLVLDCVNHVWWFKDAA